MQNNNQATAGQQAAEIIRNIIEFHDDHSVIDTISYLCKANAAYLELNRKTITARELGTIQSISSGLNSLLAELLFTATQKEVAHA